MERIRLYLGTACGKSTATFGMSLRALSKGKNVTLVFFDKREENSSEGMALHLLEKHVGEPGSKDVESNDSEKNHFGKLTVKYTGVNRIGTGPGGSFRLYSAPNGILPEDKEAAQQGLDHIAEALKNGDDIVIGDELLDVARVGLVDWEKVKEAFSHRKDPTVLVLTGRKAPDWLMSEATTISVTTQLKHHGRAIEGMDC